MHNNSALSRDRENTLRVKKKHHISAIVSLSHITVTNIYYLTRELMFVLMFDYYLPTTWSTIQVFRFPTRYLTKLITSFGAK